jgi:hypothetical protein
MELSHHLIEEVELVIAYPRSGPAGGYAVLHKAGCNHSLRTGNYREATPFDRDDAWGADDFFMVAPCAKKPGTKRGPQAPVTYVR